MLRLSQQQKLIQRLSPQQIQLMKLLQVPTADLEQRIKEELEDNPALEIDFKEEDKGEDILDSIKDERESEEAELDKVLQEELKEHLQSDEEEYNDYYTGYSQGDDEQDSPGSFAKSEQNFHDYLLEQLSLINLNELKQKIAIQIIGSIDDDGYLRRDPLLIADDLAFKQNIHVTENEVLSVLDIVKTFDPAGVGAKDLQECLILQMERMPNHEEEYVEYAIIMIESFFEEYTNRHFDKIRQQMQLTDEQFNVSNELILSLTPKPGASFSTSTKIGAYIIPDYFIQNDNGKLVLTLNARNAPELKVSSDYIDMLKTYDKSEEKNREEREALLFIKQKVDSARWFLEAIIQRQQTLLLTMDAIMNYQQEFFLTGDRMKIKPMILKDIAEIIEMDISTVSRVTNSKYVQTEYGTFLLKDFFSESIVKDDGEEVSTIKIKELIEQIIAEEDKKKPLSDERVMRILNEAGYPIARRTVTKYREMLKLPIARLRKS